MKDDAVGCFTSYTDLLRGMSLNFRNVCGLLNTNSHIMSQLPNKKYLTLISPVYKLTEQLSL